jgi:hypothetical protein
MICLNFTFIFKRFARLENAKSGDFAQRTIVTSENYKTMQAPCVLLI